MRRQMAMEGEAGSRTAEAAAAMDAVAERRAEEALEEKAGGATAATERGTTPRTALPRGRTPCRAVTTCWGFGHKDKCPSVEEKVEEANLAVLDSESDTNSVENEAF